MKADTELAVRVVLPRVRIAGAIEVGFVWIGGAWDINWVVLPPITRDAPLDATERMVEE
jgi:hypothetical protein